MKFIIKEFLRFKKHESKIYIDDIALNLDLRNPHEKNYLKSIENIDYNIAKFFIQEDFKVLDLGANIGFNSLIYLSFGASKVFAFEPVSNLFKRLESIRTDKIVPFKIALSDHVGQSEISLSSTHNQGHSLNQNWPLKFKGVFRDNLKEIVEVSTLDRILKDEKFNFIKIDVEGSEDNVIRGGDSFFINNKNAIVQIEIYDWQFKITHKLISNYYKYTYVPIIDDRESLVFKSLHGFDSIEKIPFNGPPNYIYTNSILNEEIN